MSRLLKHVFPLKSEILTFYSQLNENVENLPSGGEYTELNMVGTIKTQYRCIYTSWVTRLFNTGCFKRLCDM
jgi:hypothetical protein